MTQLTTVQTIAGFLTPTLLLAILLALHIVLPAWRVDGYAHEKMASTPTRYRLNGLLVFAGALLIWWSELTLAPLDWLWQVKWHVLAGGVAASAKRSCR